MQFVSFNYSTTLRILTKDSIPSFSFSTTVDGPSFFSKWVNFGENPRNILTRRNLLRSGIRTQLWLSSPAVSLLLHFCWVQLPATAETWGTWRHMTWTVCLFSPWPLLIPFHLFFSWFLRLQAGGRRAAVPLLPWSPQSDEWDLRGLVPNRFAVPLMWSGLRLFFMFFCLQHKRVAPSTSLMALGAFKCIP